MKPEAQQRLYLRQAEEALTVLLGKKKPNELAIERYEAFAKIEPSITRKNVDGETRMLKVPTDHRMHVYIPQELMEALRKASRESKVPIRSIVILALHEFGIRP